MIRDLLSQLEVKCEFDRQEVLEIAINYKKYSHFKDSFAMSDAEIFTHGAECQSGKDCAIMDALIEVIEMQSKALDKVMKFHQECLDAQTRHYNLPWYNDIKKDGLKYDIAVANTFILSDSVRKTQADVAAKMEGILG